MIATIVLLRRLNTSRAKVKDVSQSSISTFSMLRHSVMSGRMLHRFGEGRM